MLPSQQTRSRPDRIIVSGAAASQLRSVAGKIYLEKAWRFEKWPQTVSLCPARQDRELRNLIEEVRDGLSAEGFATVSFAAVVERTTEATSAAAITLFLTAFGDLMRVYRTIPSHWRVIDVDLARPANRSRGVGRQSLHLDFVNASAPPDYVVLFCQRADPMGGGESLVANFDGIDSVLSRIELATLRLPIFSDGEVRNLCEVGVDINPFRVYSPTEPFWFRYTANLLENMHSPVALQALFALNARLEERAHSIPLRAGDMLLVDQRRAVHGRLPLGIGQDLITPAHRRLVLHSFVRRRPDGAQRT